jgi:ubiquinone/menaquinone biosynthesis C-methylase UbiE
MKNNDYHNLLLKSLPKSYKDWFNEERLFLGRCVSKDASVLDLGSGNGRSTLDLISITKNITGIDHDKNAVLEASNRFKEYSTIKFITSDADNLPFKNLSFDYVICMGSFMNFGNKKIDILKEAVRVLKDSGKIIISTFSEHALSERLAVYKIVGAPVKEVTSNGTVIFDNSLGDNISEQFTKQELFSFFTSAGLIVEDIKEVGIAYIFMLSKK